MPADSAYFVMLNDLQYCLSDIVVVWRAWALWPGNRMIQWVLGVFMGITFGTKTIYVPIFLYGSNKPPYPRPFSVCTMVNAALCTVKDLETTPGPESVYSPGVLAEILYIPLLATNILATAIICYRAWCVFSWKGCITYWTYVKIDLGYIAKRFINSLYRISWKPRPRASTHPSG